MVCLGQAKQAADVVLRIPDGVSTFVLREQIVFDQTKERRQWLLVVLRRAMLWIRTVQGFGQDPDSRLDIFPSVGG